MRRVTVLCLFSLALAMAADVTITWDQWPYGVRYIGSYSKWWMSPDNGHVTVPAFNPEDTIWDLVNLGGASASRNAESNIRPTSEAPGTPPSQCTFAEKQIFNGATSWGYEHMDTTGGSQAMWLYGFYASGTQVEYDAPYQRVYKFPLSIGDNWTENWTWNYQGVDEISEARINYIIAQGWVRVPADTLHYYPCLVLKTNSSTVDELGQINEQRIIYEWLVPDMGQVGGSVATIQSQNLEPDPFFTDAEHVFKQKQFHSTFDRSPPSFVNTTRIASGYNLGPYFISSRITDQNGVRGDSIYYRIGTGSWTVAGHDSTRGSNFYFHIPQLSGTDSVRYYLAATDTAPSRNRGTDPGAGSGDPYSFWARDPADDHTPPLITGTTQYNDTAFMGPFPVSANVFDSCFVDSVYLVYRFNSGADTPLLPDSMQSGNYFFSIPGAGMNTFVRYRIKAIDGSPNRNTAFDPVSGYYSFNVIDATGPAFAGTTVWQDTSWGGPFPVESRITDPSGVQLGRIFVKLGSAPWDSLAADSTSDSLFHFHIPQVTSGMSVKYYLKAVDNSQMHNVATDPANAPSGYYTFYSGGVAAVGDRTTVPAGMRCIMMSVNPKQVLLALPTMTRLDLAIYDLKGGRVCGLWSGSKPAGTWQFMLPSGLANGCYVLDTRLGDQHTARNFVIAR